jgi:hypothetical protein
LVDGIERLMKSDHCYPVNLGNPGEFTILEFAEIVKKLIPTQSEIVFRALPSDDPKQRKPVIALAKRSMASPWRNGSNHYSSRDFRGSSWPKDKQSHVVKRRRPRRFPS